MTDNTAGHNTNHDRLEPRTPDAALGEPGVSYRDLVESAPAALFVAQDGRFRLVNRSTERLIGHAREELMDRPFIEFVHPDDRALVMEPDVQKQQGAELPSRCDIRIIPKSGDPIWVALAVSVVNYEGRVATLNLLTEITDRKQAELALRESEARYRSYIDNAPYGVFIADERGCYLEINPAAGEITGYRHEELLSRCISDMTPPESLAMVIEAFSTVVEAGRYSGELPFLHKDGRIGTWAINAVRLSPTRYLGFASDVTLRRRAEDDLRSRESLLQKIFDILPIGLWIADENGKLLRGNAAGAKIWGAGPAVAPADYGVFSARRLPSREPIAPDDGALAHVISEGITVTDELLEIDTFDGRKKAILNYAAPVMDDTGRLYGAIVLNQDVTEREQLLTEIREQVRRVQAILDTVPEGVVLLGADGRILLANPVAEENLASLAQTQVGGRLAHLGGRPIGQILTPPPTGLWHEVDAESRHYEVIARPVEDGLHTEAYVLVINDVTEERQVRAELRQQERLAAVGQLAAGIAHDFNNILAVIVLYAQMALQGQDLPQRLRSDIRVIAQEADHAADLVQQILDFGRRAMLEPRPMDLVPFLEEQTKLLERTLPEDIRIALHLSCSEAMVHADPTRMQQMVTNLAVNARDAMPHGGTFTIGVNALNVAPGTDPPLRDMAPGEWICLTFADTGTGIAPEAQPHIFEPFYTTKEPGKGSGLGLAQVYGIVKQHNGTIALDSKPGCGTTFTVYLPALVHWAPSLPTHRSSICSTATASSFSS